MIWYNPRGGTRRWLLPRDNRPASYGPDHAGRYAGPEPVAVNAARHFPGYRAAAAVAPPAGEAVNPTAGAISFMLAMLLLSLDAALLTLLWFFPPNGAPRVQAFAILIQQINLYVLFAGLLGLVLGVIGLTEEGCKKALSAWGAVLNGGLFLGLLTFFVVSWR